MRAKEAEILDAGLLFVDPTFRALVHSLADFEREVQLLRQQSLGLPLKTSTPTDAEVDGVANKIRDQVRGKLRRAHPEDSDDDVERRTRAFIKSELIGSNILRYLQTDFPDLWERARRTIDAEEQRLEMMGAGSAQGHLQNALERLEGSLRAQVPSLAPSDATTLTNGVVGGWLIECPLDFKRSK